MNMSSKNGKEKKKAKREKFASMANEVRVLCNIFNLWICFC